MNGGVIDVIQLYNNNIICFAMCSTKLFNSSRIHLENVAAYCSYYSDSRPLKRGSVCPLGTRHANRFEKTVGIGLVAVDVS